MAEEITNNLVYLTENLTNLSMVLMHCVQDKVITRNDKDKIMAGETPFDKNYRFFDELMKRDWEGIKINIIAIFRKTSNGHCADKIEGASHRKSKTAILDSKWWPEEKILIKSFYERKIDGGELIIQRLFRMLQESQNNTTVITQDTLVVSGLGGIGKTSIAKSYAIHYKGEYDYIFWIDCGEGSLINSFKSLARDLNVQNRAKMSLKELAGKSFSKLQECKCLVIYDNAECFIGNNGIRDVLPKHKNLYTIITSRNKEWGTDTGYGQISKFFMNVFTEEESLHFLKKSLRIQMVDSQLKKLGELLGYLPLALQIAMATLNNERITLAEYVEQIAKEDVSGIIKKKFDDYERTINKTMSISFNQIRNEEFGEIAFKILMVYGFLQPDEVDLDVFDTIETMYSAREIINGAIILEKYSLVNLKKKLNPISKRQFECLSIHRLLQQVIRLNAQDGEKEILRKILQSGIEVNYKLIPCFYAENHEDLKYEFSYIKSQLIFGNNLSELLTERCFSEAVKLSLMIHKSFDRAESNKEYLLSKYNYAVCLDKNGQEMESTKVLESISEELKGEEDGLMEELKQTLSINTQTKIKLQLKELSDDKPSQHEINTKIDIFIHGHIFPLLQMPTEECQLKELLEQRKFSEAVKLSRIIKDALKTPGAWYNYAVCLEKMDELIEAESILTALHSCLQSKSHNHSFTDPIRRVEFRINDNINENGLWNLAEEIKSELVKGLLFLVYKRLRMDEAAREIINQDCQLVIFKTLQSLDYIMSFLKSPSISDYRLENGQKFIFIRFGNNYGKNISLKGCSLSEELSNDLDHLSLEDVEMLDGKGRPIKHYDISISISSTMKSLTIKGCTTKFAIQINDNLQSCHVISLENCTILLQQDTRITPKNIDLRTVSFVQNGEEIEFVCLNDFIDFQQTKKLTLNGSNMSMILDESLNMDDVSLRGFKNLDLKDFHCEVGVLTIFNTDIPQLYNNTTLRVNKLHLFFCSVHLTSLSFLSKSANEIELQNVTIEIEIDEDCMERKMGICAAKVFLSEIKIIQDSVEVTEILINKILDLAKIKKLTVYSMKDMTFDLNQQFYLDYLYLKSVKLINWDKSTSSIKTLKLKNVDIRDILDSQFIVTEALEIDGSVVDVISLDSIAAGTNKIVLKDTSIHLNTNLDTNNLSPKSHRSILISMGNEGNRPL